MFSERAVDRSLDAARARSAREVEELIAAGLRVMRRKGSARATVADVLAEAGLGTRAFYRHFRSKDELFLAVFERDSHGARQRMEERVAAELGPVERLRAWIDEVLSLGYERPRARRTRLLLHESGELRSAHPAEFLSIAQAVCQPLARILADGRERGAFPAADPELDARSIHALVWNLVEARLAGGGIAGAAAARDHVLRFCLPALEGGVTRRRGRRRAVPRRRRIP
jgi:AcrR family transcriptional regulator